MRLLLTIGQPFSLRDFGDENAPPYAILSHTWADEEFLFSDVQNGSVSSKKRVAEVLGCCAKADEQGFEWILIDTCCIDKSSSAELSETINSMFEWYQGSRVCYAFLDDLRPRGPMDRVRHSRWLTRGWTLQELIAPANVEFFDSGWNHRGSKREHSGLPSGVTSIPAPLLLGALGS
jgi:hypothetical protein